MDDVRRNNFRVPLSEAELSAIKAWGRQWDVTEAARAIRLAMLVAIEGERGPTDEQIARSERRKQIGKESGNG